MACGVWVNDHKFRCRENQIHLNVEYRVGEMVHLKRLEIALGAKNLTNILCLEFPYRVQARVYTAVMV